MKPRAITSEDVSALNNWADPHDINNLQKMLNLPAFRGIVLEKNSVIVGFTYGWQVDEEVEIIQITVHPEHRRHGYGQTLLNHFIDEGGASSCRLEVRADNIAALNLYARYGFKKDSIRSNYYQDERGRIDAVLMTYRKANGEEN